MIPRAIRRRPFWTIKGFAILFVLLPLQAWSHHFCLTSAAVVGVIADQYAVVQSETGCPLSVEKDVPGADGRFNDFENGQIVWSPTQQLVVSAYQTGRNIVVNWKVLGPFSYDFFLIRYWDVSADPSSAPQQTVTAQTSGSLTIQSFQGRYSLIVEGCHNGGLFSKASCDQGWSNPVFVDAGLDPQCCQWNTLDISHRPVRDSSNNPIPLPPAQSAADVNSEFNDHVTIGFRVSCSQVFASPLDNNFAWTALGKLYMSDITGLDECNAATLTGDANTALRNASVTTQVGTNFQPGAAAAAVGGGLGALVGAAIGFGLGGPIGSAIGAVIGLIGGAVAGAQCSHPGDYDMALTNLVPMMYRYAPKLDADVQHHVLHDLLTQTGGASAVITNWSCCGIPIHETENHIMMTESARFLTNKLLYDEAAKLNAGNPAAIAAAQAPYDNKANGLQDWMLGHLQGFMKGDFHEYNARPYANYTFKAIHNLAEYADPPVSDAAHMVLDYLSAKWAVSSLGMRRAVPFRRHYASQPYTSFYDEGTQDSNAHDQATWLEPTFFGTTQTYEQLRYGRLSWKAAGDMSAGALGKYRVPEVVSDLVFAGEITNPQQPRTLAFFQTYRHEGVEVYARSPDFLISAGGDWEDNTSVDKVLGLSGSDTNGAALPITLIPSWTGQSQDDVIKINGDQDPKSRGNTCVISGFACGLNPSIPNAYLQAIRAVSRPCAVPVAGLILTKWNTLGAANGPLGCALAPETSLASGGASQQFERGQIIWSQPQKLVIGVFLTKGQNGFGINWNITDQYTYDFFLVRWDKDGVNLGQQQINNSDPNATSTSGSWTIPPSGLGSYQFVVEGCDSHTFSSSTCHQGWSSPIVITVPTANACISVTGNWTFVDLTDACGAPSMAGFSVAVYSGTCTGKSCGFGFFEAAEQRAIGFDDFKAKTLSNNGATAFQSNTINRYKTSDGRDIEFQPDHARGQWGIWQTTNQPASPDTTQWPLAKGDIVDADGTGCVLIKNPSSGKALVLDFRNAATPVRTSATVHSDLSCDNP
jgi:hypothetical protein